MLKIILGVLAFTIITIFVFLNLDPKVVHDSSITESNSGEFFTVSISGEILRPGTYVMNDGELLEDLLSVAGGVNSNADSLAYDLSIQLENSQSYYIAPKFDEADVCGDSPIVKVGLNTSLKEELMTINFVGSSIATSIVSYREENGSYTYIEEIMKVSGIGQATFEKIKNYITLQ
jgi:competence protein ComEA